MSPSKLSLCFSLLLITVYGADGYLHYVTSQCLFNSTELQDIEYTRSYYFNKLEFIRFDSSVGEYVGYTELGVMNAERFNKDKADVAAMKAQKETYCKQHVDAYYPAALVKSVKPYVKLTSVAPPGGKHTAMLMCSVYSFYPKQITVGWLRDEHHITSDVTSTEELQDGDWYYQIHSHLEYTPRSGEKISCMVTHPSLMEPLVVDWDPSLPESERNKIAIGASGLVLGLILALAGLIYYKTKARGRILVPSS